MKNNIWTFQIKDKDGNVVETAPGMRRINMRGPGTLPDLITSANLLIYTKRLDAVRIGLPDPGYALDMDSIRAEGHTDQTDENIGRLMPASAAPLSLPTDPAVRDAHMLLIAERLGVPEYQLTPAGEFAQPRPAPPVRPPAK